MVSDTLHQLLPIKIFIKISTKLVDQLNTEEMIKDILRPFFSLNIVTVYLKIDHLY